MRIAPDTNLLVYLFDHREPVKQQSAQLIYKCLSDSGRGLLMLQSIGEFVSVATRKLKMDRLLVADEANSFLGSLPSVSYTETEIRAALNLMASGQFSFWDGVMIATAASNGCTVFISKDMHPGQRLGPLEIMSPFARDGSPNPDLMGMLN